MDKKKSNWFLSIILFLSAGILLFFGAMILIFAIGESANATENFWWIITLGVVSCLLGGLGIFFGIYLLKNKKY